MLSYQRRFLSDGLREGSLEARVTNGRRECTQLFREPLIATRAAARSIFLRLVGSWRLPGEGCRPHFIGLLPRAACIPGRGQTEAVIGDVIDEDEDDTASSQATFDEDRVRGGSAFSIPDGQGNHPAHGY